MSQMQANLNISAMYKLYTLEYPEIPSDVCLIFTSPSQGLPESLLNILEHPFLNAYKQT